MIKQSTINRFYSQFNNFPLFTNYNIIKVTSKMIITYITKTYHQSTKSKDQRIRNLKYDFIQLHEVRAKSIYKNLYCIFV